MNMPTPNFGDLIKLSKDDWEGLPAERPNPFYFGSKDGIHLYRPMRLGEGVVKVKTMPPIFKAWTPGNTFSFSAPPIPAKLMAQIADFFLRIYARQKTEAAVLLTLTDDTNEWGVYIPTQLVSHGGVNYVYDPQTIERGRLVVGSIHSHCDFSPFHSTTDTSDAENFDGLHATIGYIMKDEPGIVAMMAMNKELMHFDKESFPAIFDFSEVKKGLHTAPAWWDRYVEDTTTKTKPIGFNLYEKLGKPTAVKTESMTTAVIPWTGKTPQLVGKGQSGLQHIRKRISDDQMAEMMMRDWGMAGWTDYDDYIGTSNESKKFNARKQAEHGVKWDKDGSLSTTVKRAIEGEYDYWEDSLPKNIVDAISDSKLLTEEDLDWSDMGKEALTVEGWQNLFFEKVLSAINVLEIMGIKIDTDIKTAAIPVDAWLLPPDGAKGANPT